LRAAGPGQAAWRHGGDATLITVAARERWPASARHGSSSTPARPARRRVLAVVAYLNAQ
jgi:hypothetical protein